MKGNLVNKSLASDMLPRRLEERRVVLLLPATATTKYGAGYWPCSRDATTTKLLLLLQLLLRLQCDDLLLLL